jgi:DNA-binding MarR family transcriptional regulator
MEARSRKEPDGFLGYTIVRVAHVLGKHMDAALAPVGLNARQFSVLVLLASEPSISGGRLARLVLVTPQSMGELVASMVASGLLEREEASVRGRAMRITLTGAGRSALTRAFPLVEALERKATRHMRKSDVGRLNAQLHGILEELSSPDDAV